MSMEIKDISQYGVLNLEFSEVIALTMSEVIIDEKFRLDLRSYEGVLIEEIIFDYINITENNLFI